MEKVDCSFSHHLRETYDVMARDGILLVAQAPHGQPNPMTIGWGLIGIVWGKPIATVLVRPSRYTYGCLERVPEFTINVQTPEMKEVAAYCGSRSGRDVDKFESVGYHTAETGSPLLDDCAATFDCRVVAVHDEDSKKLIVGEIAAAERVKEEYEPLIYKEEDY